LVVKPDVGVGVTMLGDVAMDGQPADGTALGVAD